MWKHGTDRADRLHVLDTSSIVQVIQHPTRPASVTIAVPGTCRCVGCPVVSVTHMNSCML